MFDKPMAEMDEAELKAIILQTATDIERFKATLSTYATAVRRRQRAMAMLRDRFAVCPKTGKRLRRKGRAEFDLTG